MDNRRGAMHSRMESPDGLPTRLHTAPQINEGDGYPPYPQPLLRLKIQSRIDHTDPMKNGAGAESSDSTLTAIRLKRAVGQHLTKRHGISLPAPAGVGTRLLAALRRGNSMICLWRSLRHRFQHRLCEAVSARINTAF